MAVAVAVAVAVVLLVVIVSFFVVKIVSLEEGTNVVEHDSFDISVLFTEES